MHPELFTLVAELVVKFYDLNERAKMFRVQPYSPLSCVNLSRSQNQVGWDEEIKKDICSSKK